MIWPFHDKYGGQELESLPTGFLKWVQLHYNSAYDGARWEAIKQVPLELEKRRNAKKMSIYKQLIQAQQEFPALTYDSKNPHFKNEYASLGHVIDTVKPTLAKHGLGFTQLVDFEGETQFVKTILFNEAGEIITSRHVLNPTKQDPQGYGSALTYAKRYSLIAMFGLDADKDDDANEASKPTYTPTVTPINESQAVYETIREFMRDNGITDTQVHVITKGKKLESLTPDALVKVGEQLIDKYGKKAG